MTDTSKSGEHVFIQVPQVHERQSDPHVAQGRLVVSMIVAIVVSIAAFICALGVYYFRDLVPELPEVIQVGPFAPLVSTALPPIQVFIVAGLAMVGIAATAVALETIAALMSINPRRNLLSKYRPQIAPANRGA